MLVAAEPNVDAPPPRQRLAITLAVEFAVATLFVATLTASYFIISGEHSPQRLLTPVLVATLLVANLVPGIALLILVGRRIALRRSARSPIGGRGRMHVRLVAAFSLLASVPIILTVIVASVLFQTGVQFWLSDRARTAFEATMNMVREGQDQIIQRWNGEVTVMARDLARNYPTVPLNSPTFQQDFAVQTYFRNLEQSVLFYYDGKALRPLYSFNPPAEAVFLRRANPKLLPTLQREGKTYIDRSPDTVWVITPLPDHPKLFLYAGTSVNAAFLSRQHLAASDVLKDYAAIERRARSLQLTFNAALFVVAMLIVGLAVWIALTVADRLIRPINELVGAARTIAGGDLSVRVPEPKIQDEIGTLGRAFNTMTERLHGQTQALVTANAQLDTRRALIEAVLTGVSAGVIAVGADRTVRLVNASATALLKSDETRLIGAALSDVAPELDTLLDGDAREAIVQLTAGGEARTLAVRITRGDEGGQVLTFDDITQQLLDQRRAAWSDVARRIAHEIKNPLTPIQLAAERLQRRYGRQIDPEDTTFARLTDTIVRQVGDLRRMVDEFSSFARMPKPVFRQESLLDLVRQTLFLHEVAHPAIRFVLDYPDPPPQLVCDRRQLGQALTNIVKNAVEAIEARQGPDVPAGEVRMVLGPMHEGRVELRLEDNGIGLPVERDRIVEPYMTTRSRGTGLGLAIVKKIVEEHFGTIAFADRDGGGTVVALSFDAALLEGLAQNDAEDHDALPEGRAPTLTRTGTTKQ